MDIASWLERKKHLKIYIKPDIEQMTPDTNPLTPAIRYKYEILSTENTSVDYRAAAYS